MVAIGQDTEIQLVSVAGELPAKNGDVDKHEREGNIDVATLPVAVRR